MSCRRVQSLATPLSVIKYDTLHTNIADCLRHSTEALRLPQHFPEELHNCQVCRQDHGCIVRLHHLPLLGHRHNPVPACLAHRVRPLDPGVVHLGQVTFPFYFPNSRRNQEYLRTNTSVFSNKMQFGNTCH